MAIRPILIDKPSPFLGENCALCKEPFAPGQEIIVCPEDATRHHVHCWRLNHNRCSAYGCDGRGDPIMRTPFVEEEAVEILEGTVVDEDDSKVRTLPSSNFSCAQSCLILAIAISIIFFAVSCFGLWAILDYLMIELLGWQYRDPLSALHGARSLVAHWTLASPLALVWLSRIQYRLPPTITE